MEDYSMKVGLVRHFKVKKDFPKKLFISQNELCKWFEEYDHCDIEVGKVDLYDTKWNRCFSSDLTRAVKTAETIHNGKIIKLVDLREIKSSPIFKWNLKLPFLLWIIFVRIAWAIKHRSQPESMADIRKRISSALDKIFSQSEEDVLIVSHAALMIFMRKELVKRGFKGPKVGTPQNGKLYIFEK
jgi:broad specificity phosphatase PhoE